MKRFDYPSVFIICNISDYYNLAGVKGIKRKDRRLFAGTGATSPAAVLIMVPAPLQPPQKPRGRQLSERSRGPQTRRHHRLDKRKQPPETMA